MLPDVCSLLIVTPTGRAEEPLQKKKKEGNSQNPNRF